MTRARRTETWDRTAAIERLRAETFDVLVVGGGITGTGVARDAALRGLSVALVEAGDWAGGTSSRTTKFAHGGLRYLEHLDFGLVRTALAERAVLLSIAPHLTRATPFLLPVHSGRSRPSWELRVGLWFYDALAGKTRLGRHQMLDADGVRAREPLLSPAGLRGAGVYWDARVRDARLVIETVADARRAGAVAASYCAVEDVNRWSEGWVADVHDRRSGESFTLRARACVSAAGPWGDRLRRRVAPSREPLLSPTKGVHCVVPRGRLPLRDPTALFARDGRLYFAVPAGDWTYIGTTDTTDGGDVDDLSAPESDVRYLVEATADALAEPISVDDVVGAWAGWRPLVRAGSRKDPGAISREEIVEQTAPGFLTVAGGKLTTYRAMAEEVVDRLVAEAGLAAGPCVTARRPLVPSELGGEGPAPGTDPVAATRARGLFGPDADDVFARWRVDPAGADSLGPDLPYTAAEVDRAAREMVETLDDLVDRRLLALPGGIPLGGATLDRIVEVAAPVLGWGPGRQAAETARFRAGADRWPNRPGV
ncbi:MAG TPA: glycerol-3-phosphate dehydrogenase/oxidase [Gemmatimonadota bacterium]|nr:glycerol-3-phosphate dehydrogenase/oxidase [Gemmatimonadota bacterium]